MPSSGNTPPRRSEGPLPVGVDARPLRLWIVLACEDNPKLCTGRKAIRMGLAREPAGRERPRRGALLLSPHTDVPLLASDAGLASGGELVAVDCSWNRLGRRGDFPEGLGPFLDRLHPRRLPFLLAANPQHYGRVGELNTAEALGAGVYLLRGRANAEDYFERLGEGGRFLTLNASLLEDYRAATSADDVRAIERRYFP